MIYTCPNWALDDNKLLKDLFGKGKALAAIALNSDKPLSPEEAFTRLHDHTEIVPHLQAWDTGSYGGKSQKEYEPEIDKLILSDPDAKVGGGESFNNMKQRSLRAITTIMQKSPNGSVVVTSSSLLKFVMEWKNQGMPDHWDKITPEKYLKVATTPGEMVKLQGPNGNLYLVRHGETDENEDKVLRTPDAQLTDAGKKEADRVGTILAKEQIPMTYVSPLPRTLQTADRILDKQPELFSQGVYHQLDNKTKQLKDGTRQAIEQGKRSEDSIGRAYRILEGTDLKATERGRGVVQDPRVKDKIEGGDYSYSQEDPRGKLDLISEGLEHEVYEKGDKVIKVNKVSSDKLTGYLEKLMVHNHLFPDTAYKLLGFVNREGEMLPIVEQSKIIGNETFNMKKIGMYLFNKYEMFQINPNIPELFVNNNAGLMIDDINPMNVIIKDGQPYFIDPQIIINKDKLYSKEDVNYKKDGLQYRNNQTIQEESSGGQIQNASNLVRREKGTSEEVRRSGGEMDRFSNKIQQSGFEYTTNLSNDQLDSKIAKGFLKSIGANVEHIPDTGQGYNALVDTVRGVIQVVQGKVDETTLGHEATHLMLDLLPDDSKILREIISDVQNRPEYDDIYEQYKDDKQYQNSDGTVNEDKMAKEAAAHIIDKLIAKTFRDRKAQGWWSKLWDWIKGLFRNKDIDNYQQLAEDVLDNNTTRLSKDKMAKVRAANEKGEIYYQKSPEVEKVGEEKKGAENTTDVQKTLIDNLYLDPAEASDISKQMWQDMGMKSVPIVELESDEHVYTDPRIGKVYKSVTQVTTGKFPEDKQLLYVPNKDAGNDCDMIFGDVINGKGHAEIMESSTPMFRSEDLKHDFITHCRAIVQELTADGSIILSQVIVSDPLSGVAGSQDALTISSDGYGRIYDLKTSIRSVYKENGSVDKKYDKELSDTYTSKWVQSPGSVFNSIAGDENGVPVLDDMGKMIKRTPKLDEEGVAIKDKKTGMTVFNEPPVRLSKELAHDIQVGTYGKMNELQGLPVVGAAIVPFQIDLQRDSEGFFIKNIYRQPNRDVDLNKNRLYVDQVVPTEIDQNTLSKLQLARPGYDYNTIDQIPDSEDITRMKQESQKMFNTALDNSDIAKNIAQKIIETTDQRITYVKNLNSKSQEPTIKEQTIYALEDMKRDMMVSLNKKKYSDVLNTWMTFTIRQSAITSKYLTDPTKLSDEPFTKIATQAKKFIEGYAYINGLIDQVHGSQIEKFNEAVGAVNDLRKNLVDATKQWMEFHVKSQDTKYLDQEIHNWVYGNPKDIAGYTRLFSPFSATPSIPMSSLFKTFTDSYFDMQVDHDEFINGFNKIVDQFHTAKGVKGYKDGMYKFMQNDDGTFKMREGKSYTDKVKAAKKALEDENGIRKQYRLGNSPDDIAYNLELKDLYEHYGYLTQAEKFISGYGTQEDGHYEPGRYAEYKPLPIYDDAENITGYDDYEKDRDIHEYQEHGRYKLRSVPKSVTDLKWLIEDGKYYEENLDGTRGRALSQAEIKGISSLRYRNKYYYPVESDVQLQFEKGKFTGKVMSKEPETEWILKPQFRQMRDIDTEGEDLRDPDYVKMQTTNSPEWQFYTSFMGHMDKLLLKLPAEKREYMKGKQIVQTSSLINILMDDTVPETRMQLLGQSLKNFFSSTYTKEREVDEMGNEKHSVPIGYSGSLKDQAKIDKLKAEIKKMDDDWHLIGKSASIPQTRNYKEQRALKSAELKTAEAQILPYQIEKDIAKSFKNLAEAVFLFDSNSKIESKLLMIRDAVAIKAENKEYRQVDSMGRQLFKKVLDGIGLSFKNLTTGNSTELTMIDDFMDMVYYRSATYPNSFWSKIEGLPMSFAAMNLFLFNPPVSFGVAAMMESIHLKEAFVGAFFNLSQHAKAKVLLHKAMATYAKNLAVKTMGGKAKEYGSKVEAWSHQVQAFGKGMSDVAGGSIKDLLKLEHYVEWEGTMTGAVGIALNTPVTGKDGTISDAFNCWEEQPDGTVTLPDNYRNDWDKVKHSLSRRMADYQNRFHGAYVRKIEPAVITKYPGGKSLMFLKMWMPASIWNTLGPRWVHSNLGIQEGTLITAMATVKSIYEFKGSIQEKFEHGWREMVPKGSIGDPDWAKKSKAEQDATNDKAYAEDPEFQKEDGTPDEKKIERDRDTRNMTRQNMYRNVVTLVYMMVAYGAYQLLKSLAENTDDNNTRRWSNFLAKTFDRLRKQQMFAMPVVGLEEQYMLLKSPIASLRTMGEFAEAFSATMGIVVPPYAENYYTTGVHKGELKAKVKTMKLIPGLNLVEWYKEQTNPNMWIR